MNVLTRGVRNTFRNLIRTGSIVAILGLSIGLSLAMLVARGAVDKKIADVNAKVGTTISISPAGARGFEGGGEPITADMITKIKSAQYITSVTQTLQDRWNSDITNLQSAIEAGSLGMRFNTQNNSGTAPTFTAPEGGITRSFTPPVTATGTNDLSVSQAASDGKITYISGEGFDATSNKNVAIIGKNLADKNSLKVGSTFKAYNTDITVVGIFDTGQVFGNNAVLLPLASLQKLSNQTGIVTTATATVDTLEHVDDAVTAIKTTVGSTTIDVTSQQSVAATALEPLNSVKTVSTFSLIGSVVAGAVIILLTMIMIVRERRREIGVLKAIGASNLKIMFQFVSEAVTFTFLGAIIGIGIGIAGAKPVTSMLVNNSTNSSNSSQMRPGMITTANGSGTTIVRRQGFNRAFGAVAGANIKDVTASVHLSTVGYGLIAAFTIAILGSTIPAFFIAKIKPAEVMRAE